MPATLLKLIFAILICVFLAKTLDIQLASLVDDVKAWHYLALAAGIPLTLSSFFSISRWQVFLRLNSIDEALPSLWKMSLISQFQGLVFPSSQGGDAFRMFHIERRHPDKRGTAGSTVIIERMIGLLVLCALTLCALPFLPSSENYTSLIITVFVISCIAISTQILFSSRKIHAFYSHLVFQNSLLSRLLGYIEKFHAGMVSFPYQRALRNSLPYILCYQVSLITVVYLVFRAYGYNIPFVQHFALYPVIAILTMIPLTIGGLGVREGFFVYFYGLLDVPANIAVSASLANYALMVLIPAACGGVIYLWDTIRDNRLKRTN
ncbi:MULTISPECIES: lysylphosphatidylglycerol synthase transmembrane domain-containing protein [unclassified Pseudomonas]|uniref:lysylphosphatidylglycerol synthase transmembrane domain-containing protein n=1 Tax=unclassified Pseudomonas TaxID=196821 RepID=UPI000595E3C6|nr:MULTISPECIES: lysylphosphatidylglycerol synthase transmembrane domain-containing protein [unclassified Pseudomonas]MBD0683558.1 TIGR00374 family protein [Pseudomonas sp. PSB18]